MKHFKTSSFWSFDRILTLPTLQLTSSTIITSKESGIHPTTQKETPYFHSLYSIWNSNYTALILAALLQILLLTLAPFSMSTLYIIWVESLFSFISINCNIVMVWFAFRQAHPSIVKWTLVSDKLKLAIPFVFAMLDFAVKVLNPGDGSVTAAALVFCHQILDTFSAFIIYPWIHRSAIRGLIRLETYGGWIKLHADTLLEVSGILLLNGQACLFFLRSQLELYINCFTIWEAFFLLMAMIFSWFFRHDHVQGLYALLFTWGYAQACAYPMGFSLLKSAMSVTDLVQFFIGCFFEVAFRIVREWCRWILLKSLGNVMKETSIFHILSFHMVVTKEMFNIIFLMSTKIESYTFWLYLFLNLICDILDLGPIISWNYERLRKWLKHRKHLAVFEPNLEEHTNQFRYEMDDFISGIFVKISITLSLPMMVQVAERQGQFLGYVCGPICALMAAGGASTVDDLFYAYIALCFQQIAASLLSWWLWRLRRKELLQKGYEEKWFRIAPSKAWKEYWWYLLIATVYSCIQSRTWIMNLYYTIMEL